MYRKLLRTNKYVQEGYLYARFKYFPTPFWIVSIQSSVAKSTKIPTFLSRHIRTCSQVCQFFYCAKFIFSRRLMSLLCLALLFLRFGNVAILCQANSSQNDNAPVFLPIFAGFPTFKSLNHAKHRRTAACARISFSTGQFFEPQLWRFLTSLFPPTTECSRNSSLISDRAPSCRVR